MSQIMRCIHHNYNNDITSLYINYTLFPSYNNIVTKLTMHMHIDCVHLCMVTV